MKRVLTANEEKLMEIFWREERPLTSIDIAEMNIKSTWSRNYIQNMIRSLLKKGMIKEGDEKVQYHTQYARQFMPAITREEYVAKQVASSGITKNSIVGITSALVEEIEDEKEVQETIKELEKILQQWKEREEGKRE